MANTLQLVQGYATIAQHILVNDLCVVKTLDKEYENWDQAEKYGTRGQTFLAKLPTRFTPTLGTLAFDPNGTTGSFAERTMSITADQLANLPYPITNVESALFKTPEIISSNARSAINEMANTFEKFAIQSVANSGYRFVGSPAALAGQMQSVGEVTLGAAQFQSFGCARNGDSYWIMPTTAAARTIQTGLQQFVTKRNEELSLKGEIGYLGGVQDIIFAQNNMLGVHISGTMADDPINLSTGYTITSVTPDNIVDPDDGKGTNTSTIVLSGVPAGLTVKANDLIDIGQLVLADPLKFLTFTGYQVSEAPVQGRVLANAVEAANSITFQVSPALIFDGPETNPFRNLNRAIVPGTDTVRFVRSHSQGLLYYGEYGKWVAPTLPDTEPFPSASVRSVDTGVSFRAYHGQAGIGNPVKYFTHDAIYGYGAASEGFARVIYPLNLSATV